MSRLLHKKEPKDFRIRSIYLGQYGGESRNAGSEYRLRLDDGASSICLEKRSRMRGVYIKQRVSIPLETGMALMQGDYGPLKESGSALCLELYEKLNDQPRIPKASWRTVARQYKRAG